MSVTTELSTFSDISCLSKLDKNENIQLKINNNITFVTAYLNVYDAKYDNSMGIEKRLQHFMLLLELGINICIFIEPELKDKFETLENSYKNLKVVQILTLNELELYKIGQMNSELCNLPINRNQSKDTANYMFLMLSKLEFLQKSIQANPFNSDYFCWIDFSLPYVFKDMDKTLLKIKNIPNCLFKDTFICIPGCWNFKINNVTDLKNGIVWRFCGGIVIGDKKSITSFYNTSRDNFASFLNQTQTLVWEVNYWAWLENMGLINPVWTLADHNDSIITIPNTVLV
jgi:hypothetical protein